MSTEKKGLLSRLFGPKTESDCCNVNIVNDDEPAAQESTDPDACCSEATNKGAEPNTSQ